MKRENILNMEQARRGIYILPNFFTTLNIFCGFYAVIAALNQRFTVAALCIIAAGFFDLLDGKIARITNAASQFGIEYDSLADVISFGIAPALIMYLWALEPLGRIGWVTAFLFAACGALRLARFNTMTGKVSSDYFMGLPIPAAAGMNAVIILICSKMRINPDPVLILAVLYSLSFLMVSSIKYKSFKNSELLKKKSFNVMVAAVLILVFIAAQTSLVLFIAGSLYVISGPLSAAGRQIAKLIKQNPKMENQS